MSRAARFQRRLQARKAWAMNRQSERYLKSSLSVATRQPTLKPVISQDLIVTDDDGSFRAHWKKIYGVWSCTEADHRLRWMVGKTQSEVHLTLVKMGLSWRWEGPVSAEAAPLVVAPVSEQSVPRMEHLAA